MQSKLQTYSQLANQASKQLTQSREQWTAFLDTASRLYKYPYPEQLMIYAQRPDARACAPMETWNKPMNRWVRRGSKGIALIDTTGEKPRLRYVFDYEDTEPGRRESRRPFLRALKNEHEPAVMEALATAYDCEAQGDLDTILFRIAEQLSDDYYSEHRRDIEYSARDSYLQDFDAHNIGVSYRAALTTSLAYSLLSRCGFDANDYLDAEDFMPVFDFSSRDSLTALGTGVSELSEQVLREIEVAIKRYLRNITIETATSIMSHSIKR